MFKWGVKKGRTQTNFQFYESFTYCGVEYSLYDCVYLYDLKSVNAHIGKLVRMYETPAKEKKVKVVWFFRPGEIRSFLGDYEPKWNELFLASGEGKGLSNVNPLEAIAQKCNVVCASNDKRNPQATEEELRMAEFIFYHSFDVGERRILKTYADYIDGIKVEFFLNRRKAEKVIARPVPKLNVEAGNHASKSSSSSPVAKESKVTAGLGLGLQECYSNENAVLRHTTQHTTLIDSGGTGLSKVAHIQIDDNAEIVTCKESKVIAGLGLEECFSNQNTMLRHRTRIDIGATEPSKVPYIQVNDNAKRVSSSRDSTPSKVIASHPVKKRKLLQDEQEFSDTVGPQVESGCKIATIPHAEKRRWFNQLPWREKLENAQNAGTLVLLENLDPSLASSEVEDLVWCAFKLRVEAKIMQRSSFSSPHYGKALVVFGSKYAAEFALSKLQTSCLVMTGGRPVVGSRASLNDPGKSAGFWGHLSLPEIRKQQNEETRKAVSTSHLSQPNTVECDMAMEWQMLQEKSDKWWNELHRHPFSSFASQQQQAKEIEDVKSQLKKNY